VMPFGSLGAAYFRRYGARPNRIFMMPFEPDYDRIAAIGEPEIAAVRSQFGLDQQRKRLLFCGRLANVKRVDLAIDAFKAIASERPDWDLVITGDGPLRESLRGTVPPELNNRVIWTGNITYTCVVYAIFKACDVLVLPSDHEPWALVVNEAAAAGLAIVCSNVVGAAAELVRDGVNGRLFPRGDLQSLIAAVRDVTVEETLRQMRAASTSVLAHWRERGDPVAGFTKAMQACGVLAATALR
jgi:glycosyltransferase involved in cell wall biosynthesis